MAELDRTLLLRDLSRAMVSARGYLATRRRSAEAASGLDPFVSTRWVTTRETLLSLREGHADAATPYLLGWVSRLLFLRVNAGAEIVARASRDEKTVRVTAPSPAELSSREALMRVLAEHSPDLRAELIGAIVRGGAEIGARERDAWARRGELGKRLALTEADEWRTPLGASDLRAAAFAMLDATDELAHQAVPRARRLADTLALACGHEPELAWPGRLSMRTIAELFRGEAGWLDVPELSLDEGPRPIVPATIARLFARFGARFADASAARSIALPLAHDPSSLPRRTIRALVSSLLLSEAFLVRALGLSRHEADRAARLMATSMLIATRVAAAKVLLRPHALEGDTRGLREAADTHLTRAFSAPYPVELTLVLPKLDESDPANALAIGEGAFLAMELRDRHDEDWYRNPRAVLELRDRLGRAPTLGLSKERALSGTVAIAQLLGRAIR